MDKAFHQHLKDLRAHLLSREDAYGLSMLDRALDMIRPRTLADVSHEELMGFLDSIEEIDHANVTPEWVSSSAIRTDVGLVTRGMIQSEINRHAELL